MVQGAGRTDAGVHALGQVAHFDLSSERETDTVRDALNAHLRPHPVAVLSAEQVAADFDARRSAVRRHYLYRIVNRRARSRARARPRLAGAAPARCRGDARGGAAAGRQARLHDLPLDRMPGQVAGEDARPARRVARRRRDPHHRRGALVPAQPGALDGRLAGAWSATANGAPTILLARSPPATARPAGRWRRRTGCIWCAWIIEARTSELRAGDHHLHVHDAHAARAAGRNDDRWCDDFVGRADAISADHRFVGWAGVRRASPQHAQ